MVLNTLFVHLHVHCACARMLEIGKDRHLASISWNFNGQHLLATDGAICKQDSFPCLLWGPVSMISVSFWANISKILLDLPRKMLRIAVQIGYDWSKKLVLCVSLVISFEHYFYPLSLTAETMSRHRNDIRRGACEFGHACLFEWIQYALSVG